MKLKSIISLSILASFVVLMVTGIFEYFQPHAQFVATLHTVFGLAFSIGIVLHFKNNFPSIKRYFQGQYHWFIFIVVLLLGCGAYYQLPPIRQLMDYSAKSKASTAQEVDAMHREVIEMKTSGDLQLSIDLLRSTHYWHPQMAIWIEDEKGNYVETIFVSQATARGLFFGGRSKENYKSFDESKQAVGDYRRVNALPVWSHKRGVKYPDGMFVPTREEPLPDGMTGATISESFQLLTSIQSMTKFRLKLELNVAFDDNEYYSEFDFPDDDVFHNGTGQLGQPSIVFEAPIHMEDGQNYYLMNLIGHGHHSGQTGEINTDLSTLTTALQLVERIVVGVKKEGSSKK